MAAFALSTEAVFWDDATGCLREGQILVPDVDSQLRVALQTIVRRWELSPKAESSILVPPRASATAKLPEDARPMPRPVLSGRTAEQR